MLDNTRFPQNPISSPVQIHPSNLLLTLYKLLRPAEPNSSSAIHENAKTLSFDNRLKKTKLISFFSYFKDLTVCLCQSRCILGSKSIPSATYSNPCINNYALQNRIAHQLFMKMIKLYHLIIALKKPTGPKKICIFQGSYSLPLPEPLYIHSCNFISSNLISSQGRSIPYLHSSLYFS
jgi:hypothetical protein